LPVDAGAELSGRQALEAKVAANSP